MKKKELYDLNDWSLEAIDWRKEEIDKAIQYMVDVERAVYEDKEEPKEMETGFYYDMWSSREETICNAIDRLTGFFIDRPPWNTVNFLKIEFRVPEKTPELNL